jgi:hypothetical protein
MEIFVMPGFVKRKQPGSREATTEKHDGRPTPGVASRKETP